MERYLISIGEKRFFDKGNCKRRNGRLKKNDF
jgi:hypothetical protein